MTVLLYKLHKVLIKFTVDAPEKIGHVRVGAVNSTKPRQQGHQCDANHTYTAD